MSLDKDKINSLISKGSKITGAASGGAFGFLIGGPGGAAVGGTIWVVITEALSDVVNRLLSNSEKARIGAAASYAIAEIKSRLKCGQVPRNDGFFEDKKSGRSDADEIFEGVLLKAKNEHEEKKVRILGNIFANIAFSPEFSIGEANHLLQVAEGLTYRQMCILSLVHKKEGMPKVILRENSYVDDIRDEKILYGRLSYKNVSNETISILQEAYDICHAGLMICMFKQGQSSEDEILSLLGWVDIAPDNLVLTGMGERYYKIMGLDDIPDEDIMEVAKHLV
jgi:hypothetical protein